MSNKANYLKYGGRPSSGTSPRGGGLLPLIGSLTSASNVEGGITTGMDQWGNPSYNYEPAAVKSPFWDFLFTGGAGGKRAQALNDQIMLTGYDNQEKRKLELEKERIRRDNELAIVGKKGEEERTTLGKQGDETRLTQAQAQALSLMQKDGVPYTPETFANYVKTVADVRTKTAGVRSGSDAKEEQIRTGWLDSPEAKKAMEFGLLGQASLPGYQAIKTGTVNVGPGDMSIIPNLTDPSRPSTGFGSSETQSMTDREGYFDMKEKKMIPGEKISTRTQTPGRVYSAPDPSLIQQVIQSNTPSFSPSPAATNLTPQPAKSTLQTGWQDVVNRSNQFNPAEWGQAIANQPKPSNQGLGGLAPMNQNELLKVLLPMLQQQR